MDDPRDIRPGQNELDDVGDNLRRCRVAPLVVDHFQGRAFLRAKFRHRMDEARSPRAIEPRDAQDGRLGTNHLDHLLAREFGKSVDGLRARHVRLAPRPRLPRRIARKDVVRRNRDKPRPGRLGGERHIARAFLIQFERQIALCFAIVDLRHGGAVDDHLGRRGERFLHEEIRVRDVPLRQIGDDDLMVL